MGLAVQLFNAQLCGVEGVAEFSVRIALESVLVVGLFLLGLCNCIRHKHRCIQAVVCSLDALHGRDILINRSCPVVRRRRGGVLKTDVFRFSGLLGDGSIVVPFLDGIFPVRSASVRGNLLVSVICKIVAVPICPLFRRQRPAVRLMDGVVIIL